MTKHLTRRQFVCSSAALAAGLSLPRGAVAAEPDGACSLENEHVKLVIGPDAAVRGFVDKRTGRDYCGGGQKAPLARAGKPHIATSARLADGRLTLGFGDSGVEAVLRPTALDGYLTIEVVSVTGKQVEELQFVDIPLSLKGTPDEPLAALALALNLKTNVPGLPRYIFVSGSPR